jgi:UDP-3-O-[3-hydroxymyristoyl] glucosamine N-acyltransferase
MAKALTLRDLGDRLAGQVRGDAGLILSGVASLAHARGDQLSYVLAARHLPAARDSAAGAFITSAALADQLPSRNCLVVAKPHVQFARAIELFHPETRLPVGVHPSAVVDPSAHLGEEVAIGPHAVIGAGACIGARCRIGAGCFIGHGTHLGEDCLLHARVTVQADCRLGHRVILHPGCVIGADGFGLAWDEDHWHKVSQVGRVILGDDVEIGANTTVDRGALDDTLIGDGVKLDNLIQVAHNVMIGPHTAIAGCVGIAGSTRIGANCQIGGAAMIIGHLEIADRVVVSAGTFVAKDIREAGTYTSVQPLMPHADWKRNAALLRHLDEMHGRLKDLEKRLNKLDNETD